VISFGVAPAALAFAAGLRGIFEELISPVLYVIPDQRDIRAVAMRSMFSEPIFVRASDAARGA
jgi:hypothetical protein